MAWSVLSVLSTVALQLGFGAVMARLLDPGAFGLVAMCLVSLRLFSYVSQIGLSMTLGAVQRSTMSDRDLRISLGVVWASSAASIVAALVLAPLAGRFFGQPAIVPMLQVLSASLLLAGLSNVSISLLRRQLRFKALALVEVLSYGLGYGAAGVLAAQAGAGAWALVVANLGQVMLSFLLAYAFTRHPLLPVWGDAQPGHWRYGLRHTAISFTEFLSANADAALIGRIVGDAGLGLYNRAHLLVHQPVDKAAGILTRVLFPVVTQLQTEPARVGSVFVLGVGVIGVFGAGVAMAIHTSAAEVVAVLLGPKWGQAVPVVRWLALVVPLVFMSNIAGVLCDAMNLLHFKLRLQLAGMCTVLGLMWALSGQGILGVVAGLVVGEALRFAAYFVFLAPRLHYRLDHGLRALAAVATSGALSLAGVSALLWLTQGLPMGVRLLAAVVGGALALAASLVGLVAWLSGTPAGLVGAQQLPGWRPLALRLAHSAQADGALP
jgi:O-antigen/teichoic acid export membrane protein